MSNEAFKGLGFKLGDGRVKKLKPNPKDIKAVKEALKLLKKKFKRGERGVMASQIFSAVMPWEKNPQKKWLFVNDSLPTLSNPYVTTVTRIIKKKYPELKFEFKLNTTLIDKKHSTWLK